MLSVKAVPKPGSKTIDDALSLLAAFGKGQDENKDLLEEMKAVQEHNESIYNEVHAAIQENSKIAADARKVQDETESKLKDEEARLSALERKLNKENADLAMRTAELEEKIAQFEIEKSNIKTTAQVRSNILAEAEKNAEELRISASRKMHEAEDTLKEYTKQIMELQDIKATLSAVLSRIN